MSYAVRFAPEALEQLAELENWISRASGTTSVAERYVNGIVNFCENFNVFPERGMRRNDLLPGLRVVGYRKRTTLAFLINHQAEAVIFVGVYHGGRDIEAIFKS